MKVGLKTGYFNYVSSYFWSPTLLDLSNFVWDKKPKLKLEVLFKL